MKRLITTAIAMTMVLCMGTTAFAETVTTPGDKEIPVTAKYSDAVNTPDVYSMDLVWSDMTFTYSETGTKTWNPETHTYTENTQAGWDKTTATIQMTNHSNVAVDVDLAYTPVEGTGVTGEFAVTDFNFPAGPEGNPSNASSKTAILTISGTPTDTVTTDGITVGTITVTISKAS